MFISLKEAARYCDYSPEYLSLLARKGRLAAVKMNNKDWMTTKEAIEEYIQNKRKISRT
ncbi:Helix-turn-helix domain-containing protein [Candidatus Electrothrix aarhusensis]|uniref:Helix-turn-helix domain-containing protein n=1 Tax=Candidatus Electrothrix aarhusensis TaxID=1859131 RepID=A0A3S3UE80_9BACT|nr:Helix-turn-helix domain-containing protein [Candidatus Electrothrix aarhusensis]